MEGEAQIFDLPLSLQLLQPLHAAHLGHFAEAVPIQGMHQVEVYVVSPQSGQLLTEYPVNILQSVHMPAGQLRGQIIGISVILAHNFPHKGLALPVMIGICRVDIVHPRLDGTIHHLLRLRLTDFPLSRHREAHASKAQKRRLDTQFFQPSLFHFHPSFPKRYCQSSGTPSSLFLLNASIPHIGISCNERPHILCRYS